MSEHTSLHLSLSGTPFEIGYSHGIGAKKQVHNSLNTYEKIFHEFASISWKEAKGKALLHLKEIERYHPNYLEEMDGVAKGAGVSFEDILALNARSEISLIHTVDGCTAFSVTNPKTKETWLAQNWDWKESQSNSLVELTIKQKEKPTIHMITEAGIIGKIGNNSSGIGVCLNALVTDIWRPRVPIHLGLRAILESENMEEALSKVTLNQMASCAHFLIASNQDGAYSVEVSPIKTVIKEATDGIVTHTNHICGAELKNIVREDALSDSFHRLETINRLLSKLDKEHISRNDLFHLLSNHDNYPNSVCRHN
ncbi:MAG TPA: C45 family peptidase, partial [Chondromyces sp.]|nr:C45 family peptidase [Chondromyces sp.]